MAQPATSQDQSGASSQASDRPSWKTEAIRRGNLRITGPSPADLPLVDEPIEEDKPLSPKRFTDSHTLDLQQQDTPSPSRRRLLHKASLDIGHRMGVASVLPGHKRTSTEVQETIMQSNFSAEPATYASSAGATPTTPGRPNKRQKRGSLSAAFKKIFGSRRRHERERSRTASPPRHAYHNSEPLVRRASPPRTFTTEPRGGTSDSENLPSFSENLGRGTPSQLPFPMNVNAPQEESNEQSYIAFNRTPPVHRRRATLPSVVFNSTDASTLSAIWSEGASKHDDQTSVKDEIGIAVSVPQHRQSFSSQGPRRRSNRRSRSSGALEELRKMHEQNPSFRNSIASSLWQSRNAGSRPQTSHVPMTEEEEDVIMQDEVFETPGEGASRASSRDTVMRASPPAKGSLDEDEIRAFDFGPLRTGHDSPATRQEFDASAEPPFISLDERMERLESNMRYFDESLRRLHGRQNRQTIILENAPQGRGHSRNLSSSSQDSPHYPKRPSIPFTDSQQQIPSPVSLSSSPHDAHFTQAQTAASTQSSQPYYSPTPQSYPHQRFPSPKTSLPNLMSSPSMTTMSSAPTMVATAGAPPTSSHSYTEQHSYAPDQMSALYSLLYHERAARKDLETQVDHLRREMGELRLRVERQYPRSHPDGYRNSNGSNCVHQNNGHQIYTQPEKSHITTNLYNYATYPGTQNAYPTPSPDVSILLGTTTTSSTEQLSSLAPVHARISQLNYEEEANKQRKSHFSLESDELELPDSGRASKRHSGSNTASGTPLRTSNSIPGSQRQSFLRGGPVVADHRSSSVYEYNDLVGYPPDDEDEVMGDDDDECERRGVEEYQTPLEEPDSPPPRDGEEVFRGVGVAVGGPMPVRKIEIGGRF